MAQMHQPTPPVPRAISFPCPMCARKVHPGNIFCGFCGQPLRAQCPECGQWTQENHRVCPACGSALRRPGLSFAQKHRRETLQQTLAELERSQMESARNVLVARRKQRHAIYRLLTVGMLAGTLLLILKIMISAGLSFLDLLLLLLVLIVCRSLIPALPGLGARICRWSAPGDLAYWQEEQSSEQKRLVELTQVYTTTARALADLDALTAAYLPEAEEEEETGLPVPDPAQQSPEPRRSRAAKRAPTVARPPEPDEARETPAPARKPQPSESWYTRLVRFVRVLVSAHTPTIARPPEPDGAKETPAPARKPQPSRPRPGRKTAPEVRRPHVPRSRGRHPGTDLTPRFFRGRFPAPIPSASGHAEEEEERIPS